MNRMAGRLMTVLAAVACCVAVGGCQVDAEGEARMAQTKGESSDVSIYRPRVEARPAFDLVGFTKIVASGGELYHEVRADGRWEVLRNLGGGDGTIYGVASHDAECPEGRYRYTLAVKESPATAVDPDLKNGLFTMHIPESEWFVFTLGNFAEQYGKFWQDNPYELVKQRGREFSSAVGLHIDIYSPAYSADTDTMEFWMPVKRRG